MPIQTQQMQQQSLVNVVLVPSQMNKLKKNLNYHWIYLLHYKLYGFIHKPSPTSGTSAPVTDMHLLLEMT